MSNQCIIFSEKPSQGKAYADAFPVAKKNRTHIILKPCDTFPQGATITWGIGHLVSLKTPNEYKDEWKRWDLKNLPIIPEKFEYKPTKTSKEQYDYVKHLFKECEKVNGTIINAADIDREGSNIFYSTLNMTGVKNVTIKRLWINSLEVDEVRKGFNNLQDNSKDLLMYEEARTRQVADWLVGINTSQLYTLLLQQKGVNTTLSVGRVQSPLCYMIYQRQKEIENFVSKPFYELVGEFTHTNGNYKGKAKIKEDSKERVLEILKENNLTNLKADDCIIKDVSKKRKKTKSPKLHSLSTLQTAANKKWRLSPASVLKTMQSLYEKKIVSYPRTDCNFITDSEYEYLTSNLSNYQSLLNIKFEPNLEKNKRFVDNKKVQEHYAIIPTKTIPNENTLNALNENELKIYYEILRTTVAMFHTDYEYEETEIITDVKNIEFYTKGKIEVKKGWKELFLNEKIEKNNDDKKTDENKALPDVSKDDLVQTVVEVREGHTSPPKPFTEGALINLMKTAGKMIEDEEDSEILKEIEGIGTEATRAGIIEKVKDMEYIKIKKNIVYITQKGEILCKAIEGSLLASPSMTAQWESYLKKIGQGEGSEKVFIKNIEKFLNATIESGTQKIHQIGSSLNIEQSGIVTCPSCKDGSITEKKTKKGNFYGCSNYKNGCKISFPSKIAGKTITPSNIKSLCTKNETSKLKGFNGKKGKFDAKLILNKQYEIKFSFK